MGRWCWSAGLWGWFGECGWVSACAGVTVGERAGWGRRERGWVLEAARYPRRGAGMTEEWRGYDGGVARV